MVNEAQSIYQPGDIVPSDLKPLEVVPTPIAPVPIEPAPIVPLEPAMEIGDDADLIGELVTEPNKPAQQSEAVKPMPTGRKAWACELCKESYDARPGLINHIGTAHPNDAARILPTLPQRLRSPRGSKTPQATRADFSDLQGASATVAAVATETDYKLMSEMVFDMTTGLLANGLGPEWNPKEPSERGHVTVAIAAYLKAKDVKDIPPGMMLTIVLVAYAAPRLQATPTKTKIKNAWYWFKGKFSRKSKITIL